MNAAPDIDAILMRLATEMAVAEGDFTPLMTRTQRIAYKRIKAMGRERTFVIDCSRRFGKTYLDAMLVHACALEGPGRIIRYVAPTKIHGRQFVIPAFEWLFRQVPKEQRPRFVTQDTTWIWANGSKCHLGSGESKADCDAQVGTECHLAILDEAAKIRSDLLEHLLVSVLGMQFLTTNGKIIVTSTPAETPGHAMYRLVASAELNGRLLRYTIDDCDHIPLESRLFTIADSLQLGSDAARDAFIELLRGCSSTEERKQLIREHGGPRAHVVLRELYCEQHEDPERLVIPEFRAVENEIVVARELPTWRDWYISADLGFEDLSVALFAFYDFARAKVVVWDELSMQHASGLTFGFEVGKKEAEWSIEKPRRYADGTAQLLADIADTKHGPGLAFGLPAKDDSEAALNQCRMMVQQKRIEIHPRCKTLLAHLKFGIWNERKTDYERIEGYGHLDAIDALKYLVRVVDWRKNPTPAILPGVFRHTHIIPTDQRDAMRRVSDVLRGLR